MKVGFVSLGCCKNLVDSEDIMTLCRQLGHTITGNVEQAQAIIVNTCGFIASAKEESINTIFEMARYKEKNCEKLIVVGCLAQRYTEQLREELPEVDAVIPIRDYGKLTQQLAQLLGGNQNLLAKSNRVLSGKPWQAYVKISDGCSNHCTYCAIPLIRGDQVSFDMEDILAQAQNFADLGVKELTLIAQDTTKYGLDTHGKIMLAELIRRIDKIEGLHWIRILYMYPDEIEEDVLKAMEESKHVVPYFDIPIQHANKRLLEKMNRRSSKEEVKALVEDIRSRFPNATCRTTLIIGFPSETEEEFEELLEFIQDVEWDRMGAFTYSKEEDTASYDMEPEVDPELAQARLDKLMTIQKEISLKRNQAKIGSTIEVLVEEKEGLINRYRGRSMADAPDEVDGQVIFTSDKLLELGSFVQVKIEDANTYDLMGVCVES